VVQNAARLHGSKCVVAALMLTFVLMRHGQRSECDLTIGTMPASSASVSVAAAARAWARTCAQRGSARIAAARAARQRVQRVQRGGARAHARSSTKQPQRGSGGAGGCAELAERPAVRRASLDAQRGREARRARICASRAARRLSRGAPEALPPGARRPRTRHTARVAH
jgi:hypothetical protein